MKSPRASAKDHPTTSLSTCSFDREGAAGRQIYDPSMVEGAGMHAERFLRGEDAGEDDFLSNDELGILLGMINEGEESSEEGSRPNKEKFTRRSKKEMTDFFAKHAAKRKLSSQEMSDFLESPRTKRPISALSEDSVCRTPMTTTNVLQQQRKLWNDVCRLCNSYDLDGLQQWMSCMSPSMAFRVLETTSCL